MLTRLRRLLAIALLGAAAGVSAQLTQLDTSDAVRCLGPADEVAQGPAYPFDLWKSDAGGTVSVTARFTAADSAPEVEITSSTGDAEFVKSVKAHVALWRVPCMAAGAAPVKLAREYVFKPMSQRTVQGEVRDLADAHREDLVRCLRRVDSDSTPDYPRAARKSGVQGRVLVQLRFDKPGEPPQATVFARPSARPLQRSVAQWVEGLRMPCLAGEKVNLMQLFVFRLEGDAPYGFKPLALPQLLSLGKGIGARPLTLDTTTMGCPFDVGLRYLQPYRANHVWALDNNRPERRPVLELLRSIELDLNDNALDSVFADSTTVTVPCIQLDLKGDKS